MAQNERINIQDSCLEDKIFDISFYVIETRVRIFAKNINVATTNTPRVASLYRTCVYCFTRNARNNTFLDFGKSKFYCHPYRALVFFCLLSLSLLSPCQASCAKYVDTSPCVRMSAGNYIFTRRTRMYRRSLSLLRRDPRVGYQNTYRRRRSGEKRNDCSSCKERIDGARLASVVTRKRFAILPALPLF